MNLPDLIKTGESTIVEFKEKFDERCIESLVAFANTRGGVIFIGVSDKNNIKGINVGKETINQWVNQISKAQITCLNLRHNMMRENGLTMA